MLNWTYFESKWKRCSCFPGVFWDFAFFTFFLTLINFSYNFFVSFLTSLSYEFLFGKVPYAPHIKRPPHKKEFQTLEAYNSKTKSSRTKLAWKKHAQISIFYRIDIFCIRNYLKEWSMWRGINCVSLLSSLLEFYLSCEHLL